MRSVPSSPRRRAPGGRLRARPGVALLLVLVMSMVITAVALSAILLTSSAAALSKSYDRERDLRYAAEAGLIMGKSRLNASVDKLPATGYATLLADSAVHGGDGAPVPNVRVTVYVGITGSPSSKAARFASIIADARDVTTNAHFIRRLDVSQQSFARWAYWSNNESDICFGSGDVLLGPVFSNDDIFTCAGQEATFKDSVHTRLKVYNYAGVKGVFEMGKEEGKPAMSLPDLSKLARLVDYAKVGNLDLVSASKDSTHRVLTRLEFVATDLGTPADDSAGSGEGFVKVYKAKLDAFPAASSQVDSAASWVRAGRYRAGATASSGFAGAWANFPDRPARNCGRLYRPAGAPEQFYPYRTARQWAQLMTFLPAGYDSHLAYSLVSDAGIAKARADSLATALNGGTTYFQYVQSPPASGEWVPRCYPGGDPHLAPVEREDDVGSGLIAVRDAARRPGQDTTFTPYGKYGSWTPWTGTVSPAIKRKDAAYLIPISDLPATGNTGYAGVITVDGTVAVSGVVSGKVTLYATGSILVIDDLRYSKPASTCGVRDVMGMIAGKNILVADNAINVPQPIDGAPSSTSNNVSFDPDWRDGAYVHSTVMALGTSWGVESTEGNKPGGSGGHPALPQVINCEGTNRARGCLNLQGSLIQNARRTVNGGNYGYSKRYQYDECVLQNPPPQFPTTGHFSNNGYYELDPARFDAAKVYKELSPKYH